VAKLDPEALGDLYERYGYLVHRRCLQLLGSTAEADDALQEVFLRVSRYGHPARANELGWLYRVAHNLCFDLLARRRHEHPADSATLERLDTRRSGGAGDGDRRAVLGAALARLDAGVREVGVLHHLGGLTQEEIATTTGFSRRTVGKRLGRFEAELRLLWQEAT
jgi:RNA polymerase sigma-70 factor, ECF subfamily